MELCDIENECELSLQLVMVVLQVFHVVNNY